MKARDWGTQGVPAMGSWTRLHHPAPVSQWSPAHGARAGILCTSASRPPTGHGVPTMTHSRAHPQLSPWWPGDGSGGPGQEEGPPTRCPGPTLTTAERLPGRPCFSRYWVLPPWDRHPDDHWAQSATPLSRCTACRGLQDEVLWAGPVLGDWRPRTPRQEETSTSQSCQITPCLDGQVPSPLDCHRQ